MLKLSADGPSGAAPVKHKQTSVKNSSVEILSTTWMSRLAEVGKSINGSTLAIFMNSGSKLQMCASGLSQGFPGQRSTSFDVRPIASDSRSSAADPSACQCTCLDFDSFKALEFIHTSPPCPTNQRASNLTRLKPPLCQSLAEL